jgi:hypothetical protein
VAILQDQTSKLLNSLRSILPKTLPDVLSSCSTDCIFPFSASSLTCGLGGRGAGGSPLLPSSYCQLPGWPWWPYSSSIGARVFSVP